MKITQEIIDQVSEALSHKKKDGTENWKDGDDIHVCLAGTFAADKFIVIQNRSKSPYTPSSPHPHFDYEKNEWKDGYGGRN